MGRVSGKVAFITGAARGQGRSHAVLLAKEGADIIAVDSCEDVSTNSYPMATDADLAETVRQVEALDRRIIAVKADVRRRDQIEKVVADGISQFGHIDVVVANAGICPMGVLPPQAWVDVVDTNLGGALNAINSCLPHMTKGGSIMATGSLVAYMPHEQLTHPAAGPGGAGYAFSKRTIAAMMHDLALAVAPFGIRVNCIHPTSCDTHLMNNQMMYDIFCPDIENPTREDALPRYATTTAMGNSLVDPIDISQAVLFLASDESRYVTGLQFRVDAGGYLMFNAYKG